MEAQLPPATYPPFPDMYRVGEPPVVWTFEPEAVRAAIVRGASPLAAAAAAAPAKQRAIAVPGAKFARRDTEGCRVEFGVVTAVHPDGVVAVTVHHAGQPDEPGVRHITTLVPLLDAHYEAAEHAGWDYHRIPLGHPARVAVFTDPRWDDPA